MADPISIAFGALTTAGLLLKVYTFIQATAETDRMVANLQNQVGGCSQVLEALSEVLKKPCLSETANQNPQVWLSIGGSVKSCNGTVLQLQEKINLVNESKINPLRQAWRQMKLGMMETEVDAFLSTLRTHSVNLQLSMEIVNVLVSASSQDVIIKALAQRFDKLEKMVTAIDSRLNAPSDGSATLVNDEIRTVDLDENTSLLRQSADSVMSMASTVAALSDCDDFRNFASYNNEPAFDYINNKEGNDFNTHHEIFSTTGSERGTPLAGSHKQQIQDWIPQAPQIDEMSEGGTSVIKSQTVGSTEETSLASEPEMTEEAVIYDESSDDDISYEVVQNLLSKAEEHFENQQFKLAEKYFRRALNEAEHFSAQKCNILSLKDRQLRLGICWLHMEKFEESSKQLLLIAEDPIYTMADARRRCEALHNLGCLHLRKRNLNAALIHSRQAFQGRRKLKSIGKKHPDYFKSVRLYSIVLFAQGDVIQADAYVELLPPDQRLSHADFEHALANEFSSQKPPENEKAIAENATNPKFASTTQSESQPSSENLSEDSLGASLASSSATSLATIPAPDPEKKTPLVGFATALPRREQPPIKESKPSEVKVSSNKLTNALNSDVPDLIGRDLKLDSDSTEILAAEKKIKHAGYYKEDKVSKGLLWAAQNDDFHAVNYLLKRSNVDVNIKEKGLLGRGKTPLSYAVENGSLEMCIKLIERSADVDHQASRGETLLLRAAIKNLGPICQLLLRNGADIHCAGSKQGPLSYAAEHGNLDLCKVLLSYGANLETGAKNGVSPLHCALKAHKLKICEFLAYQGASLEDRLPLDIGSGYVRSVTPLIWTTCHGHTTGLCRVFLANGADVDGRDQYKETALMHAAFLDNINVCKILLEYGADLTLRNMKRQTAAAMARSPEIKKLLLAAA